MDRIKTRLQVQSNKSSSAKARDEHYDSTSDALRKIISNEGILGLYAGLPAGLIGVASTNFAYFYWYSFIRTHYQRNRPASSSTAAELALGALAGILAQIFTIPVSVITTRQQTAERTERKNLIGTAKEIISESGITGLWKGIKPSMVLCVNPAITYGAFERFKDILSKRSNTGDLSPGVIFCLGALSKTIATIITYPYIMAKVRLQCKPPSEVVLVDTESKRNGNLGINSKRTQREIYSGALDVLRKVLETDGIQGWYNIQLYNIKSRNLKRFQY
ncbi:2296_t:CDS:2 [Acaulospora colombiana]|uniref:2296_t:CDS:1 n=1 Tax=Acaulospora colombiana TaxID=27376 RepID=A0ACA9KYW6_9GLOM|nr:2296_t:CDS:2 [Acaulospora colombiana]